MHLVSGQAQSLSDHCGVIAYSPYFGWEFGHNDLTDRSAGGVRRNYARMKFCGTKAHRGFMRGSRPELADAPRRECAQAPPPEVGNLLAAKPPRRTGEL